MCIQLWINKAYIRWFDVKMEEFDTIASYPTLNALFTRSLIKMRSFDKTDRKMIAPCDSTIMELGACKNGIAMQIKGKT